MIRLFITSFMAGGAIIRTGLWLSKKYKILDDPRRAAIYQRPRIPTGQGVVLYLARTFMSIVAMMTYGANMYMIALLVANGILIIVTTIDTFYSIPAGYRFARQSGVIIAALGRSGVFIESIQLGPYTRDLGSITSLVASRAWCMLCINAINRFDGISGQTSGVASVGYATIRALVTRIVIPQFPGISEQNLVQLEVVQHTASILLPLSLIYTIIESTQKGLLRDPGTYMYGFSIAYIAMLGGAKIGTLVVVFSLVILDAIRVIAYRIFVMKKNPLKGDLGHLHHRLLALGWNRNEVRAFTIGRSIVMSVLILSQGTNSMSKFIIMSLVAVLFFGIHIYLYMIKKLPALYELDDRVQDILNNGSQSNKKMANNQ